MSRIPGPAPRSALAQNSLVRTAFKARLLARERAAARRHPVDSLRFLLASPEVSNFTYELENRDELARFLEPLIDAPAGELEAFMVELDADEELRAFLSTRLSRRRGRRDDPRYGKRHALYAIIRALRPQVVAETGTHDGLSTMVMARALDRNGSGRVLTFDLNPEAGWLIGGPPGERVERFVGSTEETLGRALAWSGVDVFFQDSTPGLERFEHQTALGAATGRLVSLTDDVGEHSALPVLAEERRARFGVFHERPARHFWRGNRLGVAVFG